jgi:hypothetical protein
MSRFTKEVLRQFNQCYEYNLTEEQLDNVYKELSWQSKYINHNDILDEFEMLLENI